ncbi:MAG: hypothetical protein WBC63_03620 [Candidatus Bipolaricaulia bacterium]
MGHESAENTEAQHADGETLGRRADVARPLGDVRVARGSEGTRPVLPRGPGVRVAKWCVRSRPVAPWPYFDVSISQYLQRIESLGENPEDYDSIWYYF